MAIHQRAYPNTLLTASSLQSTTTTRLMTPGEFISVDGSAVQSTLGASSGSENRTGAWLFDATTQEAISGFFARGIDQQLPLSWASFHLDIIWSNAGAGAGDVQWRADYASFDEAESTESSTSGGPLLVAAPAQYVVKISRLLTSITLTKEFWRVNIRRVGDSIFDTLPNDAGVIGVKLTKG